MPDDLHRDRLGVHVERYCTEGRSRARAVPGVDVTAELRNCEVPLLYLCAAGDWVVR